MMRCGFEDADEDEDCADLLCIRIVLRIWRRGCGVGWVPFGSVLRTYLLYPLSFTHLEKDNSFGWANQRRIGEEEGEYVCTLRRARVRRR